MDGDNKEQNLTDNDTLRKVNKDQVFLRTNQLSQKYGLEGCLGDTGRILEVTCEIIDHYQIPETFLEDDVNFGLIIGSAQKLLETQDPFYQQRIKNFLDCLVQPVVAKGTSITELKWNDPESNNNGEESSLIYASQYVDREMSQAVYKKLEPTINECKVVWEIHGFNLDVEVMVVDRSKTDFKINTGASGFIHISDENSQNANGSERKVTIVLPKDETDNEDLLIHELFHIRDKFDMVRRGYKGRIFENIDELHTEFAVGNYGGEKKRQDKNLSSYLSLKNFWHKIIRCSNLRIEMLGDRNNLFNQIITEFGFEGLTDLAMLNAHSAGKSSEFETLYISSDRALLAMLIAREKISLRKNKLPNIDNLGKNIEILGQWLMPESDKYIHPRYKTYFSLIPNTHTTGENVRINSEKSEYIASFSEIKDVVLSYPVALAYLELIATGELSSSNSDQILQEILGIIPFKREKIDYDPEESSLYFATKDGKVVEEYVIYNIEDMYLHLVSDIEGIDFVCGLVNLTTRTQILSQFFEEVDKLAKFCLDSKQSKYVDAFVGGLFRNRIPWEIREQTVIYLLENHPEISKIIEEKRKYYSTKNAKSVSL
jgi:hypothetical protein